MTVQFREFDVFVTLLLTSKMKVLLLCCFFLFGLTIGCDWTRFAEWRNNEWRNYSSDPCLDWFVEGTEKGYPSGIPRYWARPEKQYEHMFRNKNMKNDPKVNLEDSVESCVRRSKPFTHRNGLIDFSFMDEPIRIVGVLSRGDILYKQKWIFGILVLESRWNDGTWFKINENECSFYSLEFE